MSETTYPITDEPCSFPYTGYANTSRLDFQDTCTYTIKEQLFPQIEVLQSVVGVCLGLCILVAGIQILSILRAHGLKESWSLKFLFFSRLFLADVCFLVDNIDPWGLGGLTNPGASLVIFQAGFFFLLSLTMVILEYWDNVVYTKEDKVPVNLWYHVAAAFGLVVGPFVSVLDPER